MTVLQLCLYWDADTNRSVWTQSLKSKAVNKDVWDHKSVVGGWEFRKYDACIDGGGTRFCRKATTEVRESEASLSVRGSTLRLHRHHRSIHLIDSLVASSSRGCDTVLDCVLHMQPPPHTGIHINYWSFRIPPSHIWKGIKLDRHLLLGGSKHERHSGVLSLKLIPSSPAALTCRVKVVKPQNVQLLWLHGICGASGLFVSAGVSTCSGGLCARSHCMCHSLPGQKHGFYERHRGT